MKTLRILLSLVLVFGSACVYAQTDSVHLVDASKSAYKIIYGAAGGDVAKNAATQFQTAIKNVTGVTIPIATDATASKAREIILGPTNTRPECAMQNTGIKAAGAFGYRIALVDKKVIITANDANHMVLALKRFEAAILKETAVAGTGFLYLEKARTQVADFSQTQATLRNIVAYDLDYTLERELCVRVPKKSVTVSGTTYDIKVSQDACTDGTHAYMVIRNSGDAKAIVYKYRMSDWKKVGETSPFNGGHCNGLFYDWPNQRVICLRGGTDSSIKEETMAINPSTMKVTTGPTVPSGATAMDYNHHRGLYVTRYGSNLKTRVSAKDNTKDTYTTHATGKRTDGNTMTSQGMGSDEDYFYFPMSPKNGETYNALLAYDYKTVKFKKELRILKNSTESEGMFSWKGIYYVTYYESGNGASLYKLKVTLTYKAGV